MEFGVPRRMSFIDKILRVFIFLYALVIAYSLNQFIAGCFAAIVGAIIILTGMKFFRNTDRGLFEIKDGTLFYKNRWGSIKNYPIEKFDGRIETFKKYGIEERLVTPGLTETKDWLYIGELKKKEKALFIESLKKQVAQTDIKKAES